MEGLPIYCPVSDNLELLHFMPLWLTLGKIWVQELTSQTDLALDHKLPDCPHYATCWPYTEPECKGQEGGQDEMTCGLHMGKLCGV